MNILLIGLNNPIAYELEKSLKKKSFVLYSISSTKSSSATCKIDLSNEFKANFLKRKIKEIININFDCIINFSTLGSNYDVGLNLLSINLKIYKNISIILKNLNFRKFINISSIYVNELSKKENNLKNDAYYALSKYLSEYIFLSEFKNKIIINLRLPQIISPRYKYKGALNSLFMDINKNNHIKLYGNANRIIKYIHISDAIDILVKILKSKKTKLIKINGKKITLKNYATDLINRYGNKNTKITYY